MTDSPRHFGPEIQGAIYLRGVGGAKPEIPTSFSGLEAAAKQKMSPEAWAYTAGGAGLETAMEANRAAFARYPIAPRVLGGAGERNLATEIFGVRAAAPVMSSPIGVLEMMHPEADLALRGAMARPNLPMIKPSLSAHGRDRQGQWRWPALFPSIGASLTRSRRALSGARRRAGARRFSSLDTWRLAGARGSDLGFAVPSQQGHRPITSDPVFRAMLAQTPEETRSPPRYSSRRSFPIRAWIGRASPRSGHGQSCHRAERRDPRR